MYPFEDFEEFGDWTKENIFMAHLWHIIAF
jgi:hypothetical protein